MGIKERIKEAPKVVELPTKDDDEKTLPINQKLRELADSFEFFKSENDGFYAIITELSPSEAYDIKSRDFELGLRKLYFEKYGNTAPKNQIEETINHIESLIRFDKYSKRPVFERIGNDGAGRIYIDTNDEQKHVIVIDSNGYDTTIKPNCIFLRNQSMSPLPLPSKGGELNKLRELLSIPDDATWDIIIAWLFSAYMPKGPYPILVVQGEHGSGKSTLCRILVDLINPNNVPLKTPIKKIDDLMIAAKHDRVLCFDNMSGCSSEMSDALCRIASSGAYSKRQLFSNGNEFSFNVTRPIILNGIDRIAQRQDLADRSFVIYLPGINSGSRKTEKQIWEEFVELKPSILGAMYEVLANILKNIDKTNVITSIRMIDAVNWVTSGEEMLGWPSNRLVNLLNNNKEEIADEAIEDSCIAQAIIQIMEKEELIECLNLELCKRIKEIVDPALQRTSNYPKTYKAFSDHMQRIAPSLRVKGIYYERIKKSNKGALVKLWKK